MLNSSDVDGVPVAVCQLAPRFGEVESNRERASDAIVRAADRGARMVVLPELATSGYAFSDKAELHKYAEPIDGSSVAMLTRLARRLGIVIVAGLPEMAEDRFHNSAVVVDRTGLLVAYRKVHLWDRELDLFTPGVAPPPVVDTEFGRVGVVICYDLEFPEWMRLVALAGADIVAAPTNWPTEPRPVAERAIETIRVQASAAVNRVFIAVADRVGAERGIEWVGGSSVIGLDGYPLALADDSGAEQILVARCALPQARDKRTGARNDALADRRHRLYGGVLRPADQR